MARFCQPGDRPVGCRVRLALALVALLMGVSFRAIGAGAVAGGEYFVDTDPGQGNAIPFAAEDGGFDGVTEGVLPFQLTLDSLAPGLHRVGFRFRDETGQWGNLGFLDFRVLEAATLTLEPPVTNSVGGAFVATPLAAAEYTLDGATVSAAVAQDGAFDHITESLFPAEWALSGLTTGVYRVGIRFQDGAGNWGNLSFVDFRVQDSVSLAVDPPFQAWPDVTGPQGLTAAELTIDQGAPLPVVAGDGAFDSVVELILPQVLDPGALTPGVHRLAIRLRNSAGEWGNHSFLDLRVEEATSLALQPFVTNGWNAGSSVHPLVAAELTIGGVTTSLAAADGALDSLAEDLLPQALAVSGLTTGLHRMEVRFQDATGAWGNACPVDFRVEDAAALALQPPLSTNSASGFVSQALTGAEVQVDGGPPMPLTALDGVFDNYWEDVQPWLLELGTLSTGLHRLSLRCQSAGGNWGTPIYADFRVEDATTLALAPPMADGTNSQGIWRSLKAAEYFIDESVPPGMGQPLASWDGTFDSVAEELAATVVPLGLLAGGYHRVGVRFQAENGVWGGEVYQGFRVYSLAPEPPSIVLQPVDVTVDLGRSFALTAVANGDAPLGYRWFRNGLALAGATNETYAIAVAQLTNAGSYYAVITNGLGSITSRVAWVAVATPPPVITCPSNQVLACGGPGTPATFSASALDSLGATVPVICSPPSGSAFPVGRTTVTCIATDTLGASNRCTFQVTVEDRVAPSLQCPGALQVAVAAGECGAAVDYSAQGLSATDGCSAVVLSCIPPAGTLLPLGTNLVACTATDGASNATQCTFPVHVRVLPQAPVVHILYPQRDGLTLSNQAQVCLTTTFSNGTIYFTDDGSAPDVTSRRYTNCVDLFYEGVFPDQQVVTIKAVAVSSNGLETAAACPVDVVLAPFCDGNFKLLTKAANDGGGEVRKNPVREKYPCDVVVRAEAYPAAGWSFMGWLGDAAGTNLVTPVVLTRDKCVEGVFGTVLRTNVLGNGTVRVTPAAPLYPYGSQVSVFALPAPGYYFSHWTNLLGVDITPSGRTANPFRQRIADALPSLTAVFLPLPAGQHTLTVLVEGMGSVNSSPFSNRYAASVVVTNRATPAPGQRFLGWTGDATGTNTPLLVTMDQSRVITAQFTSAPRLEFYRCEGRLARDTAQLVMRGDLGGVFELERAEELGMPLLWQPLGKFTNTLGWAQYDDPFQPSARQRYYRLRLVR